MVDSLNKLNALNLAATQPVTPAGGACAPATSADTPAPGSFRDLLMQNLQQVNQLQQDADTALENFTTGKTQNVGEVISASQKAGMAFSMLVQIRNKLQEAYDEVKNLRV